MIRHFVSLRFRADVSREAKQSLYDDLDRLRDHLPGILAFQAVENVSVEHDLVRGILDGFWFDFTDTAARNVYLDDARHQAVGARIVENLEGGIDGVAVFDMEI